MMNRYSYFIMASLFFSVTSWASDENNCGRLHVQIANGTSSVCQLISSKIVRGILISSPPTAILPGDSKRFDMTQAFSGPNIILEYSCHNEHVIFESQQNYCFLQAGDITGTLLPPINPYLQVTYTAETGSFFWSRPGIINWFIQD